MKRVGKVMGYIMLSVNLVFIGLLLLAAYSPFISPLSHPYLSCMGLTFPIFLVINICFFVFWLITHYKYALVPLMAFVLCYPQIRTYIPFNIRKEHPKQSVKILSYNIMSFGGMKLENGKNTILEYIRNSKADIICLQEYNIYQHGKGYIHKSDILDNLKMYPYTDIRPVGTKGSLNCIACFSKYPILSARRIVYPSHYNGSAFYELKIGDDTVSLINNHLESNKLTKQDKVVYDEMLHSPNSEKVKSGSRQLITKLAGASAIRSVQADLIAREIALSPHKSVIVCGDFNDSPISYTHRVVAQNLADAFTSSGNGVGVSYNQHRFYFRLDNILLSRNLRAYECTVDRSISSSDHYPIWCYVKF